MNVNIELLRPIFVLEIALELHSRWADLSQYGADDPQTARDVTHSLNNCALMFAEAYTSISSLHEGEYTIKNYCDALLKGEDDIARKVHFLASLIDHAVNGEPYRVPTA